MTTCKLARKVFLWSLCITDWVDHDGCSHAVQYRTRRRNRLMFLTAIVYQLVLILWSLFTAWWHIDCEFVGSSNLSFLFVASYILFYWPVLTIGPVICLTASILKTSPDRRQESGSSSPNRKITWVDIFRETTFSSFYSDYLLTSSTFSNSSSSVSKFCTFIGFSVLLCASSLLEVLEYTYQLKLCKSWSAVLYMGSNIWLLLFYSNFSYFLYLKRKCLESECERAVIFIRKNIQDHERCSLRAKAFFREYYQLKRLLFPWLNFIMFSSAFGLTFFLSWRFYLPFDDDKIVQPTTEYSEKVLGITNGSLFCSKFCKEDNLNKMRHGIRFPAQVVTEKFMIALLALHVVKSLDLKYQWNRFKMKMYIETNSDDNPRSWKRLSKLVDRMHPDSSTDVIASVIIPLLGIVAGFLGGEHAASKA